MGSNAQRLKAPAVFLYFLLLKPPETLNTRSPTLPPPCSQLVSLGKEETRRLRSFQAGGGGQPLPLGKPSLDSAAFWRERP